MNKLRIVFSYEFSHILRSKSFLLTLVLIPLAGFLVVIIISGLQKNNEPSPLTSLVTPPVHIPIAGVVDASGIIRTVPDDLSAQIKVFPDEAGARAAIETQQISGYYLIPADYLSTGQVEYYSPDFNPVGSLEDTTTLNHLLEVNLLSNDPPLLKRLQQPMNVETHYQASEPQRDPNSALTFFLPYGITMLFYVLIMSSSSTMLSSITNEKQNRVMEMLLTSMTPTQMLGGKILALGSIGLLQAVVWSASGYLLLRLSGRTFSLPVEFTVPLSVLLWGIVFFLLGYAMYASLMAGIGAMVPNLREGSQATFLVILPMVIPLFFINTLIGQPNGTLSVVLSFFPLTSPLAIMTRLGAVNLPFWQPLLAAVLQAITAVFIVKAVAGMFRAQNLLAGQQFNLKLFFNALLGKA